MAHIRKEFSDQQKALIFCRDRATCCFSSANLWLLDAPLRQSWEANWTDHVLPSSRGGEASIENGVCASATFNGKKRNNTNDTKYLVKAGVLTPFYFALFGPPSAALVERLRRLAALEPCDWYYNQMINSIFLVLHQICWPSDVEGWPVRGKDHWLKAAYSKLQIFQKKSIACGSFEERGLVENPSNT
ncbi:MAG: hypothetical protein JWO82_3594, partial [Akkermansiaceae bacterium]|nr:hypothetical protein [Akkermansiaceae bacterium]